MSDTPVDDVTFTVVVNDEEQYSIWPAADPLPTGWIAAGFTGPRDACLAHIETVWVDMRPRSVREAVASAAKPVP